MNLQKEFLFSEVYFVNRSRAGVYSHKTVSTENNGMNQIER